MGSRYFAFGAMAVVAGITAAFAVAPLRHSPRAEAKPGSASLHVFGGRSAAQTASPHGAKFDAALGSIARHYTQARPGHEVEDLRGMNPGMRFMQPPGAAEPLVLIDAITRGDPQALKATLEGLGLKHASVYSNDVGGWLPVSQLDAATQQFAVHAIRAAMPQTRSGAVTTQGDFVMNADVFRSDNSLDGGGVTVGILSDSYNCYTQYAPANSGVPASGPAGYASNTFTATATDDINSGDLPANSDISLVATANPGEAPCFAFDKALQLPMGDEGRAMMQIVHDVAPGAKLAFHSAEYSEADFANGILALADAGAKVIADDVGYFDEPFYQDGIVAQAITQVASNGVTYFSAAGNNGNTAYDDAAPSFPTTASSGPQNGEQLLNFPAGIMSGFAGGTTLPLTIPALVQGEFVAIIVEWDQPYISGAPNSTGSLSSIDLCVSKVSGSSNTIIDDNGHPLATGCTGASSLQADPVQLILIGNPASASSSSAAEQVNISVGLASGPVPGRLKIAFESNGANLGTTPQGPTMQGHPYAAAAAAVGAAFYYNTPGCGDSTVEMDPYSSQGGDLLLFDVNGARLTTPTARNKPDFVGPDGGNDTFLGFTLSSTDPANTASITECKNNRSFPNFFGTSAATPHVAAVAALMLQADPALTNTQILAILRTSTIPTDKDASFAGAGFVQANLAAHQIPAIAPAAPTLTLGATSLTVGGSTTITWSSVNTGNGCTASGAWSGALASNGQQTLTPSAAGMNTYSLYCTNAGGNSPTTSVTLSVTAAPSSGGGGGGGALDGLSLLALGALAAARRSRRAASGA